jgi:hypothetical protein
LCDTYGPLFAGTENERQGKDWLLAKFKEYGLENVRAEEFRYMGWKRGDVCKLELIGERSFCGRPLKVFALPRSPPTSNEGVEGEILYVGCGTREDFEDNEDKIPGRIVMARSGGPRGRSLGRIAKYNLAREMGAEGYIFMFGAEGDIIPSGAILWGPDWSHKSAEKPPAVAIPWETGQYLLRLMKKGPVRVRITTNNEDMPETLGWNIIGDITGYQYPDEVILIGAHFDGHDIGQGALDDALGACAVLNVGRALANYKGKFKRTLKVVNFGVEELSGIGSRTYVEKHKKELDNIICMFDCDGFARHGDARVRTPNDEVFQYLKKVVKEEDIPIMVLEQTKGRGWSDATPFLIEGVPIAIFVGTPARVGGAQHGLRGRYPDHTAGDTVDKLNSKTIRTASMKFAQILISMLNEEKRFATPVLKEEILRDMEETRKASEAYARQHPSEKGAPHIGEIR